MIPYPVYGLGRVPWTMEHGRATWRERMTDDATPRSNTTIKVDSKVR